jgi:O-antigen ligase
MTVAVGLSSKRTPLMGRFSLQAALAALGAVTLVLSWLTTEHFLPWVSWHSEAVVFFAVLVLAWGAVAQMLRATVPRTIALPLASLPLIGLALIAAVQRATGLLTFNGDVWALWFYVALCIACLALGFAAATPSAHPSEGVDASEAFTILAWALLLGALASTVIAFAQVFSLWEHSSWIVRMPDVRRPGGNLAQPNHLATLQVMGVASLLFLRRSNRLGALACSLILLVLCAGLAVTESRTGALCLLALLCWWLLKRRTIGDPSSAWLGVAWGAGFLGMFLAWPYLLNATGLLGYQIGSRVAEGGGRLEVWPQLLHAIAMRPWTGWGFHQVAAAHDAVADQYAISEPYSYSHNLVLDLLIWLGVPLALLFVGAVAIYAWRRARATTQLLPWYGLAVALPLAVHSMLEYPFTYAYFLAPVMFVLGAVEALTGAKPLVRVGVKSTAAFLVATTVVMSWSVIEYLEIEEDFRVARFESLRIGSTPPEHTRPRVILFDQLGVLLADARITPKPNMSPEAMQQVKNAALYYPWSATQYRYAVALALNGNPVEATRQLRVIHGMWNDKVYGAIKRKIDELAATEYPQLRQLSLPEPKKPLAPIKGSATAPTTGLASTGHR